MTAMNNATQPQAYGLIATILFLTLFATLETRATPQQTDLTHTRGDANQALIQVSRVKIEGSRASAPTLITGEQTNQGGRNASGGRDSGDEEPVVVVIDGYQSSDTGRLATRDGALIDPSQTNQGGRNASGGRDSGDEEPVVVVIDGYQSSDTGRLATRDGALIDPSQTNQGGRNASGGRDSGDEEPVVVVIDGYQSADQGDVQGSEADLRDERTEELPSQATLHGNYPNPFNPSTTIRFELTEAQPVRLAVYNALGQQVQVLADSQFGAGQHEVRFDAMNLASGLYLARLETPGGVSVQRMMLAK